MYPPPLKKKRTKEQIIKRKVGNEYPSEKVQLKWVIKP